METIAIYSCKYILTHASSHSKPQFLSSLLLVQPYCGLCSLSSHLVEGHSGNKYALTQGIFSLLQINRRFRVSPSPTPTEGCLHHFFTSFAVGFIIVIFLLTKVLFCPSFSFLPRSCLHLHYPCPWQQVPILQLLSFLSLSVVAFALTPWGFTLI